MRLASTENECPKRDPTYSDREDNRHALKGCGCSIEYILLPGRLLSVNTAADGMGGFTKERFLEPPFTCRPPVRALHSLNRKE